MQTERRSSEDGAIGFQECLLADRRVLVEIGTGRVHLPGFLFIVERLQGGGKGDPDPHATGFVDVVEENRLGLNAPSLPTENEFTGTFKVEQGRVESQSLLIP